MARDNFSINTTRMLAERVGYLCSNPVCRTHTVGPNQQVDKSTKIGEAAHITAAAQGGPRFDAGLTPVMRSHIENGIWLCSNCSDLIDKDPDTYPTPLLKKWKANAEHEMYLYLKGQTGVSKQIPFLEADLKYYSSGRRNIGYSDKNPTEVDENGRIVMPIRFDGTAIAYWKLDWEYGLAIYNNSSHPAFNIQIVPTSGIKFSTLGKLAKINHLKPFDHFEIEATFETNIEDTHVEADKILEKKIPDLMDGLTFEIIYLDEARNGHRTVVKISDQDIINMKV
jgi:hypothetical protein